MWTLLNLILLLLRENQRGKDAYNQRGSNNIKWIDRLVADSIQPVVKEQLEPYKDQQERYPHFEVMEQVDNLYKKEEERPEADDGENIWEEYYVGVCGNREDGRNWIKGEDHVSELNHYQNYKERRKEEFAINPFPEMVIDIIRVNIKVPREELNQPVISCFNLLISIPSDKHVNTRIDQECTKDK